MATAIHCVTGATDGIGFHTALELVQRGVTVLVHGRTLAKAKDACAKLEKAHAGAVVKPVWGDFGLLAEVRGLAAQVVEAAPTLDVLINNAGIFMNERQLTKDGLEATLQVNHLAPFLLTNLVRPALEKSEQGRVVNVSSMAHARGEVNLDDLGMARGYSGYAAYAASKLMNVHFTHELARRLEGTRVTTYALHPGVIGTKLLRTGFGMGGGSVDEGTKTSLFCATEPSLAGISGRYYSNGKETPCSRHALDVELEGKLWAASEKLVGGR